MIIDDAKRRREREMGQSITHGNGNACKKGREEKRETYLKLELIKQYRMGDRCVLLALRLQKKRENRKKGMSQQVYGVSRRKALYKNNEDEVKLEITYSPLSSGGCKRRGCLPLAASSPARRRSISRWPQSSRPRLACSRALAGMGTSRRGRRAL